MQYFTGYVIATRNCNKALASILNESEVERGMYIAKLDPLLAGGDLGNYGRYYRSARLTRSVCIEWPGYHDR